MSEENTPQDNSDIREELLQVLGEAKSLVRELREQKVELIDGSDDKPSLKQELLKTRDRVKEAADEIVEFHGNLHDPANDGAKAIVQAVSDAVDAITKAEKEVAKVEAQAKELREQLFGDDDTGGILKKGVKAEVEEKVSQVNELHSKIFDKPDPNRMPLSEEISAFLKDFTEKKSDLEDIISNAEEYEAALLGESLPNGERVDGIKDRVGAYVSDLDELINNSTKEQNRLLGEANKLLTTAGIASLAHDSEKQKESFTKDNSLWMVVFFVALTILMASPAIDFTRFLGHVETDLVQPQNSEDEVAIASADSLSDSTKGAQLPTLSRKAAGANEAKDAPPRSAPWYILWLMRLPFIAGAIWLAIYASRQRSQNKRLQQEYAYKENVAKTYYALKKEIEDLEKVKDNAALAKELKLKVIDAIITSVKENPSATLDSKSHDDKGPMMEAVKSFTDKVPDLINAIKSKVGG